MSSGAGTTADRGEAGRLRPRAFAASERVTARELALAAAVFVLVGCIGFGSYVLNGGFSLDDWADAAAVTFPPEGPGVGGVLDYYADIFPYRPGLILYVPLKHWVLGTEPGPQLAWGVALAVIVALLLYGILRRFRVPWQHAMTIGALTVIYPWFDSTRFWEAANLSVTAVAVALAGFWLAIVALDRRSWRLHLGAAALYLVSILIYEIALPAIAAAGIVYVLRAGWRTARGRWAVDLAVVAAAGLWNATHTNREVSGLGDNLDHLWEIVLGAGTLLGRTVYPLGPEPRTTPFLVALGLALAAGLALYLSSRRGGRSDEGGWGLRGWLLLAAGGLALAAAGWAMFIPADPFYTPTVFGGTNRVNALAGLGLVIAVYATGGVAVAVFARLVPAARRWAAVAPVILGLLLGAAYLRVVDRHADVWIAAYEAQLDGFERIERQVPRPPEGATIFASNYPAYQTLGVPIFSATWDLNGLVKLEYDDGSLSAYPVLFGQEIACRRDGIGLRGENAPPWTTPYGKAFLVNLATETRAVPRSRAHCLAVAGDFLPGPMYISTAY